MNVYCTEQSKLQDDYENDDNDDYEPVDVIRGTEVIENVGNIMPMANDVTDCTFGSSNSTCGEAGITFMLYDLESICRTEQGEAYGEGIEDVTEMESETCFPLPNRSICNAHTLSLIGRNDLFEALSNVDFANQYFQTFEIVNQLWNVANQSNKNIQIVKQWIGKKIPKPHRLRWNRIFAAVCFLFIFKL